MSLPSKRALFPWYPVKWYSYSQLTPKVITVSIVEDNRGTRNSLAQLLRTTSGIQCVSVHANGEDALAEVPKLQPRVLLMDINLPGMSGIECVARLKPDLPNTQVLMLTVYEDQEQIFNSLRAGATGYLLKTTPLEQVTTAIEELAQGGAPMSASIARKVVNFFNKQAPSSPKMENLTPREREILDLLAKGYPNKDIADRLCLSHGTIRNHLDRIYRKLHIQSRTEAVLKYLGQQAK